jgi:hypothetical protein
MLIDKVPFWVKNNLATSFVIFRFPLFYNIVNYLSCLVTDLLTVFLELPLIPCNRTKLLYYIIQVYSNDRKKFDGFINSCECMHISHNWELVNGFNSGFYTINSKRHSNPSLIDGYEK